jgi:hypothetical protein
MGLQRDGAFSPGGGGGFESCERLNRPVRRTLRLVGCVKPPALTHLPYRAIPQPGKRPHSQRRHRSRHGPSTIRCVFTGRWRRLRVVRAFEPPGSTHPTTRRVRQASGADAPSQPSDSPSDTTNARTRGDVTEAATGLQRYGAFSPGGGGGFELRERLNRPVRRTLPLVGCVKPPALTHLPNRAIPPPDKRPHSQRRHRSRHGPSTIRCVFTGRWRRLRVVRAFEPPGSTHPTTRRVRQASGADAPSQPSDSPSRQTPALAATSPKPPWACNVKVRFHRAVVAVSSYCNRLNRPVRRTLRLVGCVKPPALTHLPNRAIPQSGNRPHSRWRHRSRHRPSTRWCVFTGRWRRLRVTRAFEPPGSTHPTAIREFGGYGIRWASLPTQDTGNLSWDRNSCRPKPLRHSPTGGLRH